MSNQSTKSKKFRIWGVLFRFIIVLVLLFLAGIIWFERDGGKTLVHTTIIELTGDRYLLAKLSRPIAAQSLDQRPAVIFVSDRPWNRWATVAKTSALTKRGVVTLAVDPVTQGDRKETVGAIGSETSLCDLLTASVAFAKSQPFIADNGVIVEISRYSEMDYEPCAASLEADAVIVTDITAREAALRGTGIESIRFND